MKLIADLTKEEIQYICDRIPTAAARYYFQKNSREFAKIRPGFRAEKLSDSDTRSILVKNVGKHFITAFVEKTVLEWLNQIEQHTKSLEQEGYTAGEALLKTIPESVFCDNSELYFKVLNTKHDEEYLALFRDALSIIQKDEEDLENLDKEEQRNAIISRESDEKITELESELEVYKKKESDLTESLHEAQLQMEELESKLQEADRSKNDLQADLDRYRNLSTYADEGFDQSEYKQFQHVSIGRIIDDYSGQIWIERLADIVDGEVREFFPDDTQLHCFDNRNRLYWKDGPDEKDAIGIWNWNAEPRKNDPSKDYVKCNYNRNTRITEVVELPECKTLAEVASRMAEGIGKHIVSEKVLFVCTTANGVKEGLLCYPGDIKISGDTVKLASSVFTLPHYSIKQSDTIKIAGVRIFRKINLGIPQSMFRVRPPYDAVKEMLLSKVTIPALRDYDFTRKEAQKFKRFFEDIPTQTIIQDLMDAYECTEKEADDYLNGFVEHADTYLFGTDLDMNTISTALGRNPDLIQMCKEQLRNEWEAENSDKIEIARKQLEAVTGETEEKRTETQKLIQEKDALEKNLDDIKQRIEYTEQFAEDVENKINERIEAARKDASDFVSEMAFISPVSGQVPFSDKRQNATEIPTLRSRVESVNGMNVDDIDTFEEELTENMMLIGYEEEVAIEMALAISFCICNRLPVVIGENASEIGKCLAATIGGKNLTQIFLPVQNIEINNLLSALDCKKDDHPSVFLLHGVLDSYNVSVFNTLSAYLQSEDRNIVLLFSLEGIPAQMISPGVWNKAFYIDGDNGLTGFRTKPIHAITLDMKYERIIDNEEYKTKKKEINIFDGLISNLQLSMYAKYLAAFGISLNESETVLWQMITISRSAGTEEKLKSLFHERGITNGEKLIAKYL